MADPSFSSLLVTVVGTLAKDYGWDYFEKLRRNDIMLVQGNQQVSDMVKRGERAIAVGADARTGPELEGLIRQAYGVPQEVRRRLVTVLHGDSEKN